jgi:glycerol-3-phosphate acyltransferase PlsY
VFAARRIVSLASLAAAATFPIAQALTGRPLSETLLGAALTALILARHRHNLARLAQGTEPTFTIRNS